MPKHRPAPPFSPGERPVPPGSRSSWGPEDPGTPPPPSPQRRSPWTRHAWTRGFIRAGGIRSSLGSAHVRAAESAPFPGLVPRGCGPGGLRALEASTEASYPSVGGPGSKPRPRCHRRAVAPGGFASLRLRMPNGIERRAASGTRLQHARGGSGAQPPRSLSAEDRDAGPSCCGRWTCVPPSFSHPCGKDRGTAVDTSVEKAGRRSGRAASVHRAPPGSPPLARLLSRRRWRSLTPSCSCSRSLCRDGWS